MNNQISTLTLDELKKSLISDLQERVKDKILEPSNFNLLQKLINNADNKTEAISIATLGTTYKRTGFHFDKRLEKQTDTIKYFKKNDNLSFVTDENKLTHKLIIGDNYDALLNLSISYKNKIDVIYIDPPYGKDDMGEFAHTNYDNAISRDNLLSSLYPRLTLARELLTDEGVIFCSIDDKNQAYVKGLFDEVFGENFFVFSCARLTKKGGKSSDLIQKNHDYVICYSKSSELLFSSREKNDDNYKYEDEYVNDRGKYALTQPLDYDSLQYNETMDYEILINNKKIVPGGDYEKFKKRHEGVHANIDWVWRWSKDSFEWGLKNGFIVYNENTNRIYTKTYLKCRKANGKNEIEYLDGTTSYTTREFIENDYSNDNGKKNLDIIFSKEQKIFQNPKPVKLLKTLVNLIPNKNSIILDFYAGSGTTGQAVLELNRSDGGSRQFILVTNNEITDTTPNGIAYDVTSKRLKRVMTGKCYDGKNKFKWNENNKPLGDNLDVYEIVEVANNNQTPNESPFEVIDETLYGLDKLTPEEKIKFVCENFAITQKSLGE